MDSKELKDILECDEKANRGLGARRRSRSGGLPGAYSGCRQRGPEAQEEVQVRGDPRGFQQGGKGEGARRRPT